MNITPKQMDVTIKWMVDTFECDRHQLINMWDLLNMLGVWRCTECYCEECRGSTGDIHTHGPLGIDYIDTCDECHGWGWDRK